MNLRRAGLAVLAASALTVTSPPVAASAASAAAPARPAVGEPPATPAQPDLAGPAANASQPSVAGPAAGAVQPDLAGPAADRGWPFTVPDVSGLLPGLFAVNVASLQCLTASRGSGPASERRCALDDAYRWKLVPVSLDGRFKVENAATGRCLVPAGGADLAAGPCGSALGDTWHLRDAPGTGIYVINAASDRCLTVERDGSAVQYRCDGDVSRRWTFRLTPHGRGVVTVNGGKP